MRTTFKNVSQSLIFVVCIVVTLALASGVALACSTYDYDYDYSFNYSDYGYGYYGYGNYFGYGQNQGYQDAVDYYADWQYDAYDVSLYFSWGELNNLCKTYKYGEEAYMEALVDWTNQQLDEAIAQAQRTRKDDVALLRSQEAFLVANVKYWSRVTGVEVICEYVNYYVDGQWVSIDPLRVV